MKFSLKIFISVFVTMLALGSFVIWAAYRHVSHQTRDEYVSRYSAFSRVMSDTLSRLDANTESLMLNAAKVVAARDAEKGLLSTQALKDMRSELSVTHIFVVDKNGKFIRSTNEDPSLIPNAFSFCEDYRHLYSKAASYEATPIIQPMPEPKPYKFLFVPSRDQSRLLEVAVRVDFLAKTLTEALGADSNLVSMSLFAPDGNLFGKFDSKKVDFLGSKVALPITFPYVSESDDSYRFFTKVTSSHPHCCQCEVSGTSRNGEYYYVLASEISKKELKVLEARTRYVFMVLTIINLLFAMILSRFISRRLVRNIETAAARIRSMKASGDLKGRINLDGKDEIAFLTDEFDRMLDSLEESQERVIEAEKVQIKVQMAKEIAHNIKSPAIAIEMMMPMLVRLPDKFQKVFKDSVREIKSMAERLTRQADSMTAQEEMGQRIRPVCLSKIIEDVVHEKQVEYTGRCLVSVELIKGETTAGVSCLVDPTEFRSVLSNIINNAIESYPDKSGRVTVKFESGENEYHITVSDNGMGIPADVIPLLGKETYTVKEDGRGIGLVHANRVVSNWDGRLTIDSQPGNGTDITVSLPLQPEPGSDTVAI